MLGKDVLVELFSKAWGLQRMLISKASSLICPMVLFSPTFENLFQVHVLWVSRDWTFLYSIHLWPVFLVNGSVD